jgi:aminopeptidase
MMTVFERLFGAYPFPQYTVVITEDELEIPIEAQGMSAFGANQLRDDHAEERLVAHELAHQWFGNSLTVQAWRHIWLNEGFACYAEWLWSEQSGGPSADRHATRHWQRLAGLPQDLVVADPGPKRMFDARLSKQGALTLHPGWIETGDVDALAQAVDHPYQRAAESLAAGLARIDAVVGASARPHGRLAGRAEPAGASAV